MSFPNGSGARPDKIFPQVYKDLTSKSDCNAGLISVKSLLNS